MTFEQMKFLDMKGLERLVARNAAHLEKLQRDPFRCVVEEEMTKDAIEQIQREIAFRQRWEEGCAA